MAMAKRLSLNSNTTEKMGWQFYTNRAAFARKPTIAKTVTAVVRPSGFATPAPGSLGVPDNTGWQLPENVQCSAESRWYDYMNTVVAP